MDLRSALVRLCASLAEDLFLDDTFLTPQSLMSEELVDRIVDLAHNAKIKTASDLRAQVSWSFLDTHGSKILELIQKSHPTSTIIASSPFTNVLLGTLHHVNTAASSSSAVGPSKQRVCKNCLVTGHYGT